MKFIWKRFALNIGIVSAVIVLLMILNIKELIHPTVYWSVIAMAGAIAMIAFPYIQRETE